VIYPVPFKEEQKTDDFMEVDSGENEYLRRRQQVAGENL